MLNLNEKNLLISYRCSFSNKGGLLLNFMTNKKLIGVRDPYGIRPLVIGKLKNSFIFASETCALDIVGAKIY